MQHIELFWNVTQFHSKAIPPSQNLLDDLILCHNLTFSPNIALALLYLLSNKAYG